MWSCNKKLAAVFTVVFLIVQFKVLSWAVSVHKNDEVVQGKNPAFHQHLNGDNINSNKPIFVEHENPKVQHKPPIVNDAVRVHHGELPTLYKYYTSGGIQSGLVPTAKGFLLNGKPLRIISGAMHYFRVHPAYWRDRLRKLRAAGLNAVETYVAWNLHEPQKDVFDFGQGTNDMTVFLDLVSYIKIAQEEDLFVIFRPGPYICSEWDFGGMPSWLLRDHTMQVRTSYAPYLERVDRFLEKLIPLVVDLQFTASTAGPIIAVQVENEYGAFGYDDHPRDGAYLQHLADKFKSLGVKELLFTSDSPYRTLDWGAVPGVLQTANLQDGAFQEFQALKQLQPDMPLMVTEFWSGWFDHWTQAYHSDLTLEKFQLNLNEILQHNSSVSFYMFHGGTNFGFMNGANAIDDFPYYMPDVTSYDYDALLSEAGDYTEKYEAAIQLITPALSVKTRLPQRPAQSLKMAYTSIELDSYMTFDELVDQVPKTNVVSSNTSTLSMEQLPINNGNGQSYGFVIYRKNGIAIKDGSKLKIRGHVRDLAQVLVNGQMQTPPISSSSDLKAFGSWYPRDALLRFGSWKPLSANPSAVLDIVVENLGRVNYGKPHDFKQKKGLWEGPILLDGKQLYDWQIIPLEFKADWVKTLAKWKAVPSLSTNEITGPVMVKATLHIADKPADTFLDMSDWGKGVVFVNGFNLGRYWSTVGPQQTLYLPAPLLQTGDNTIVIYEQYQCASKVKFTSKPILGKKKSSAN